MADGDAPNSMQAQLGLIANTGSFNPVGMPTNAPPVPTVQHPGEVSQNAVQWSQTQAMQTLQSAQMGRPTPVGSFSPFPTYTNSMGFGGGNNPYQNFAGQFQQNMMGIGGGNGAPLINSPFYAQALSSISGGQGYMPNMLPPPTGYTDPSMGLYRPFPQQPYSMVPPVPQLPFIRHPFVPNPTAPRYQTPYEYDFNYQQQRTDQWTGAALATPPLAARIGTDYAASWLGTGVGAGLGAMIGGPGGARIGSTLGALGGLAISELGGFSPAMGRLVDQANPLRAMSLRSAQFQGMSRDWVSGGSELAEVGQGFNRNASLRAGRMIEDLAYSDEFASNRTGRHFSVQDLTRVTQEAGRSGMLDFAQTPEAVRDEVRNIAKQLKTFMQVANEPDVREAIRQMGNMRSMGLNAGEAGAVNLNARLFSRMAGTTIRGLNESSGYQGGLLAQQSGLSAGLGLQLGQGSLGMARQGIVGGAYSVQDIAMLGGPQGMAQRTTEGLLSLLKMPLMAAAGSRFMQGGMFGLDSRKLEDLLKGRMGIPGMAQAGVSNLHSAIGQGGIGALGMFLAQQNELQDKIGRALGPMGLKALQTQQILQTQKDFGFDKSPGGLWSAAKAYGMDDKQAYQFMKEANSPEFFSNMRRQVEVQIRELRGMTDERYHDERGGYFNRLSRQQGALYAVKDQFSRVGRNIRTGVQRTGEMINEYAGDTFLKEGVYNFRTSADAMWSSDAERRNSLVDPALGDYERQTWGRYLSGQQNKTALISGANQLGRTDAAYNFREGFMGGQDVVEEGYRRRQGGALNTLVPTWAIRGARALTIMAQPFNAASRSLALAQEAAKMRTSEERGNIFADNIARGVNRTVEQRGELVARVAKDMATGGVNVNTRDVEHAVGQVSLRLGRMANQSGSSLFRSKQMTPDDLNTAIDTAPISADMKAQFKRDTELQQHVLGETKRTVANFSGAETLDTVNNAGVRLDRHYSVIAAANDMFQDAANRKYGRFDSQTRDMLAASASVRPEIATLAELRAAKDQSNKNDPAETERIAGKLIEMEAYVRANYSEEDAKRILQGAESFYPSVNNSRGAEAGRRKSRLTPANMVAAEKDIRVLTRGGKQGQYLEAGLRQLSDKGLPEDIRQSIIDYASNKTTWQGLQQAIGGRSEVAAADKGLADLLASNEADAGAAFRQRIITRGESTSTNVQGGGRNAGPAEKALQDMQQLMLDNGIGAGSNFPQTVDIFKQASNALLEAAIKLGGGASFTLPGGADSRWERGGQ